MLRRIVKFAIAVVVYYSGFLALYSALKRKRTPQGDYVIFTYHRVLDDADKKKAETQPGMCVTRKTFDKQVEFLSSHYNILSLEKLTHILKNNLPVPRKTAVITFDDGWRDNYLNAFPVLKKHKTPATIFPATDLIETDRLPIFIEVSLLLGEGDLWPEKAVKIFKEVIHENRLLESIEGLDKDKLDSLGNDTYRFMRTMMLLDYKHIAIVADRMKAEGKIDLEKWENDRWMLNWDEIREMFQHDIDFGSHGQSHDILIHLSDDQVRRELTESKKIIEKAIGKPVTLFSYPNGDYNTKIEKMVLDAGYDSATALRRNSDDDKQLDIFALERISVNEGAALGPTGKFSKAVFACLIEDLF